MIRKIELSDQDYYYKLGEYLNFDFKKLFNLDEIINKKYNYLYVYEENNQVQGFIHLQQSFEEADIINIVVNKANRNKHIATLLIDYAINKNNLKILNVEVRTKNPAVDFYKKLDFIIYRTINNYYENDNAYFMKKVITND